MEGGGVVSDDDVPSPFRASEGRGEDRTMNMIQAINSAIDVCMALERIGATLAAEKESESAGKTVPLSRDSAVRGGRAALDGAGREHRGSAR